MAEEISATVVHKMRLARKPNKKTLRTSCFASRSVRPGARRQPNQATIHFHFLHGPGPGQITPPAAYWAEEQEQKSQRGCSFVQFQRRRESRDEGPTLLVSTYTRHKNDSTPSGQSSRQRLVNAEPRLRETAVRCLPRVLLLLGSPTFAGCRQSHSLGRQSFSVSVAAAQLLPRERGNPRAPLLGVR